MSGAKKLVLIVDDDVEMGSLVRRLFVSAGYKAEVFETGASVIERLQKNADVEAVVTDKDMPEVDGFQVARRAHEISPAIAVVLMTAHGARLPPEVVREIDAYVRKPFRTPNEIVDAVALARNVRHAKVQAEQLKRTLNGLKSR